MDRLFLLLTAAICVVLLVLLIVSLKKKSKVLPVVCAVLATAAVALSVCSLAGVEIGGNDNMRTSYITVGKYETAENEKSTRSTRSSKALTDKAEVESSERQTANSNSNHEIVYITKSGKKYHYSSTCGKGTYYECPYEEALKKGYEPCQKCVTE